MTCSVTVSETASSPANTRRSSLLEPERPSPRRAGAGRSPVAQVLFPAKVVDFRRIPLYGFYSEQRHSAQLSVRDGGTGGLRSRRDQARASLTPTYPEGLRDVEHFGPVHALLRWRQSSLVL